MPVSKINRDNCWTAWNAGRIAAANVAMDINSDKVHATLANLAINRGYNAVRLWLSWADAYSLREADFIAIAQDANGWNSTRLNANGTKTYAQIATRINEVLDACEQLGMGVVFVIGFWSSAYGRMWVDTAADANYPQGTTAQAVQNALVDFWGKTAQRFGKHKALVGYDLLNEPGLANQLTFAQINDPAPTNLNNWRALVNRVATAVRASDAATPLVVEGIYGADANGLSLFDARDATPSTPRAWLVNDTRVVYSFHFYAPGTITHQGVTEWAYESIGKTFPAGSYWRYYWYDGQVIGQATKGELRRVNNAADLAAQCQRALDFKKYFGVPVFVGEFSIADVDIPLQSGAYGAARKSEVGPDSEHRMVTSIVSDGSTITVNVGNIDPAIFGWNQQSGNGIQDRDAQGFSIDCCSESVKPFSELAAIDRTKPESNFEQYFTNTVWLTVQAIPGTPGEADVKALNIVRQPVTIRHADGNYVFAANAAQQALGRVTVAQQAPITSTTQTVWDQATQANVPRKSLPAVATLTIEASPAQADIDARQQSRVAYATQVLAMFQKYGLSWAWLGEDTNDGGFVGWRPSAGVAAVIRNAAMGRSVTA